MTTLARVSLWLSGERDPAVFEPVFAERLAPVLASRGLRAPVPSDRSAPLSLFSRLFAVDSPAQVRDLQRSLRADPAWRDTVERVASRWALSLYSTPVGPGRTVRAGSGYRHGAWLHLGVQDGLPSALAMGLCHDRQGHLWVGIYGGGVCEYDGHEFRLYGTAQQLIDELITDLAEDQQGCLWFCAGEGVTRFDGHSFAHYTAADDLPDDRIAALVADQQARIWLRFWNNRVCYWDGRGFHYFGSDQGLPADQVHGLAEDLQGRMWFATGRHLSCFDGRQLQHHEIGPALPQGEIISSLLQDRQGGMWMGTSVGLRHYAEGHCSPLVPGSEGGPLRVRLQDRRGNIWCLTSDQGLVRYDGSHIERYTVAEGLGHNWVRGMAEDREGYLWFSTWGGGLARYDGNQLHSYPLGNARGGSRVEAILEDRSGQMWMATWGEGLWRYDGTAFRTYTRKDGLAGDRLWCLCEDRRGRIWAGTFEGGVSCFDGERFTNYGPPDGLAHRSVWCICQDDRGRMWFGTQGGGVSCFDGERFTTVSTREGLPDDRVWAVAQEAGGSLWFSVFAHGVCRYDGERLESFSTAQGLAHDQVWCIRPDGRGRVWFGTWGGGVSCYDGQGFTTYTTAQGLADNNVRSIWEGSQGHLWFGTFGGGVSRYDGQVFQTFSRKDGLVHDAVQDLLQDRSGRLWIATEGGVTCYEPPRTPPAIHLEEVIADRPYGPVQQVEVTSAQEFVIFEFQGSSLTTAPERLAYVYRLEGHETEWRTTYARKIEYRGLPVGDYTFQVRAVDRDLNYSPSLGVALQVTADTRQERIEALQAQLSQTAGLEQFIGQSPALQQVLEQIHTVAGTEVPVLVLGETGTGKGLAARAIHSLSQRREQPFIQVNCGAIPEGLVASELFGHEKGAFTGALNRRIGRFELADGGTLFLDEIGDLPLESQRVLLQVLQERTVQRVGGEEELQVDVRVVAATNRDLRHALQQGTFREDLFYRLSGFALHLPPLRERREDIPVLVFHFAEQFARHLQRAMPDIDEEALAYLQEYAWPGNVRELEHLVRRAVLVGKEGRVRLADLQGPKASAPVPTPAPADRLPTLDEQERRLILEALASCNWIVYGERGAAALLGVHPERLRAKMRKHGLTRPAKRGK